MREDKVSGCLANRNNVQFYTQKERTEMNIKWMPLSVTDLLISLDFFSGKNPFFSLDLGDSFDDKTMNNLERSDFQRES